MKLPTLMSHTVVRRARGVRAIRVLLAGATLFCAFAAPAPTEAAPKGRDKREIKAREAFAGGRYDEALDLFAKLYAEKLHPTYLRNIGRCYQNLRQPEKAINAFRDYLRQAKDLSSAEKIEIEGYIAEMEALKKKQDNEQAARAAPPPRSPIPVPAAPPVPASHGPTTGTVSLTEKPTAPSPQPSQPFYKSGWFWGVVGGVVVVGAVAGGLYGAGVFSPSKQCPAPYTCK